MQNYISNLSNKSNFLTRIVKGICTRLDGCPIVNNVCVDCLTVKNYWELLIGDDGVGFRGFLLFYSIHPFP